MKKKVLFFYGKSLENNDFKVIKEFEKDELVFVGITELKQARTVFSKFIENELSSVRTLRFIYQKIVRKFISKIEIGVHSIKNSSFRNSLDSFDGKQMRKLTEYINAEIYEKADKISVDLFNKVKNTSFIAENFIFNDINLFETNRLEFVEKYYQFFLIALSIQRILEVEKPDMIYLSPNLPTNMFILIKTVMNKHDIELMYQVPETSTILSLKRYIKRKVRLISEYNWYWIFWKVFNKNNRTKKRIKKDGKINLILSHYKNHFPALIQFLVQINKNTAIKSLLYIPHKLFNYSKEIKNSQKLTNVYLLPHQDYKYKLFKKRYYEFGQSLARVAKTNSFDEIYIESIQSSTLIKLSFINLAEKFLDSIRNLENLENIFKEFRPELITMLSGNDAIDVLATRLAKKLNILTLFFPHAVYSIRHDHDAFEQDYVICSGKKDEEYFLSLGTEKEKIHVLGLVLFDKLYHKFLKLPDPNIMRKKIIGRYNLEPSKKLILLVTTHDEDFVRERVFKSVIELIKNHLEYQLIVKIHPVENISFYRNLMKRYGISNVVIVKDIDLHEIIISSDLIIGRSSGAQIEAILLDKKVIDLSYEATSGRQLMEKFKAVIPVYDPHDLEKVVRNTLYNEDISILLREGRKKYCEYALYKFDGNASLRVKNLIEKILN